MANIRVALRHLKPGMQVADDVYNRDAQLIVPKGVSITERILERLDRYNIESVVIYPPKDPVPTIDDEVSSEPVKQEAPTTSTKEEKEEAPKQEVKKEVPKATPPVANKVAHKTHSQKIRESEEFLKYSQAFEEATENFKFELSDIADRNAKVDVDKMFGTTAEIIEHADSSYQVFDMLHNMRNFDDSTFAHSLNVSIICNIMGKWLNMPEEEVKLLTVAGLMHDIGKLLIPNEIITKPGKLTDEEYQVIKQHPSLGYKLLVKQDLDPRIAQSALCHHEKCDGTGYPLRLNGAKIPPFAKIVCIVDIYEAMTADRVYRKGLCPFEVIRSFERDGFQKYDPQFILTFLKGIVQTYMHETVELSNGETGTIVMINDHALSQPMVNTKNGFLDLSKNPDIIITQIL